MSKSLNTMTHSSDTQTISCLWEGEDRDFSEGKCQSLVNEAMNWVLSHCCFLLLQQNTQDNQFKSRKCLFSLVVLEASVHSCFGHVVAQCVVMGMCSRGSI